MNNISWSVPYLPNGKNIFTAPTSNLFMARAKVVRDAMSTDLNHSTGAVIVKDGVIIGEAANQAGFKSQCLIEFHRRGWCVRKIFKIKSGTKYWLCPGCSTHDDHAESGAVKDAITKHGLERTKNADVYLYGHYWCCKPCWEHMIAGGVKDVYVVPDAFGLFGGKR